MTCLLILTIMSLFFMRKTCFNAINFILFLSISIQSKIHIWEPKSLKSLYHEHEMAYSVMNFGLVPYGHSVYGTVFKATPLDGCSDLAPLKWDKNYGTLIILLERGGCNFSEKVFNAQKVGAGLVLIADNSIEDVHKIFPVERTKELLDRIHIPSVLIRKEDGDNIKAAIDAPNGIRPHEGTSTGLVELAIHFHLLKNHGSANVRIILQVDDYRSYELIIDFMNKFPQFKNIINLQVHFKIFMNADLTLDEEDCKTVQSDKFCVVKSFGNTKKDMSLIGETVRQLCLNNNNQQLFIEYSKKVRDNCFGLDRQVLDDFPDCTNKVFNEVVNKHELFKLSSCLELDSKENREALMKNHDEIKYFLINYSPLIFINGYYYKSNFDDLNHLFETICNGFEVSPQVCYSLDSFMHSEDLNSTSLGRFVFITFGMSVILVTIAIMLFYIIYKQRIKKQFTFEFSF